MCYSVYISTDSPEDLRVRDSELVRFEKVTDSSIDPCAQLLDFANRWYVGSKSGCSCTLRHLASSDLGFSAPVEWYPEEEPALAATHELYAVLTALLSSGYKVDLVDLWEATGLDNVTTLDVSFNDVSATAFRLFENHKFRLTMTQTT
jgi:hypothetical protein